ncbi:unnamed protein product [Rangifer tarandus platyrhynchus]|uniref:Uncharacterized protein n=1 Tax=Rangifer tarandus platyrhynchus TaxID=3082113 RepID=A0ABN8YB47_RANTA|nr:unnamed protein product [Rangifer tarandus platyrhynchus]
MLGNFLFIYRGFQTNRDSRPASPHGSQLCARRRLGQGAKSDSPQTFPPQRPLPTMGCSRWRLQAPGTREKPPQDSFQQERGDNQISAWNGAGLSPLYPPSSRIGE